MLVLVVLDASLPAWMAAGIESALQQDKNVTGEKILTIGYGSGDAAEIIPMEFVEGWQEAAGKINFAQQMNHAVDLSEQQYQNLHDFSSDSLTSQQPGTFVIDRVGDGSLGFDDRGIEYYKYQHA